MNNEDLKKLVKEVLNEGFVMSLGTVDDQGVWVADVIYVDDDRFNLYWVSMPDARHSKAIEKNNKVALTVTASWATDDEKALQIEGIAERIDGPLFEFEKKLETKRGLKIPEKEGEILSQGHVWYVIKPTRIELMYSKHFGYDRKGVNFE